MLHHSHEFRDILNPIKHLIVYFLISVTTVLPAAPQACGGAGVASGGADLSQHSVVLCWACLLSTDYALKRAKQGEKHVEKQKVIIAHELSSVRLPAAWDYTVRCQQRALT